MCGIIGSVNVTEPLHKAISSLYHRGPDSFGLERFEVRGKTVQLAHTRLAILDLSPAGHQPMPSQNKRWWVSFNGEIYNHLELRKTLECDFRGHSDTETLVELLAEHNDVEKVAAQLNGMFAFAALDIETGKLYLVRDPFGVKPIYYAQNHVQNHAQSTHQNNQFTFASEVRSLKVLGKYEAGVSEAALDTFLTLRYVPSPLTLWKGIKRLPPGHILSLDVDSGHLQTYRYIKPKTTRFSGSMKDAIESYETKLKQAVEKQLLSDVPVGLLLSGGIDSALIAAISRDLGHKLPCFTVGFGNEHNECEISDAEETANILGLPHHPVTVTPETLQQALPAILASVEEPLGTTSILPMWYLVQRAREDVTVVLTGQGTDEPWGGYRRYQVEMVRNLMPYTPLWKVAQGMVPSLDTKPEFLERGLRTLSVVNKVDRFIEACSLFPAHERLQLTGRDSSINQAHAIMDGWHQWLDGSHCKPAEEMMRLDTRMNLSDDLLLYGDKISMATSLEARVPMLDISLVEFIESLPLSYRVALSRSKIVHKRMAENYLPSSIVHRKKKGFQVPFGTWSRGIWREWIESVLLDRNAPHFSYLEHSAVKKLWNQHQAKKPDRSRQMFALLMLAVWWQQQAI